MPAGHRPWMFLVWLGVLAVAAPEARAWETVRVVLREPDGATREVVGTGIAYGYFKREFTPGGVRDRLRVERSLVFADRDVRFPDLRHIRFDHETDGTTGLEVPTTMHVTFERRKDSIVEFERPVSELQGYGNPKPVVLIVHAPGGKVQVDLTPGYEDEARQQYRPVLEVIFE